ncbi:MAG: hypothetical protein R2818_04245 [Flavobacteriales bacterium]
MPTRPIPIRSGADGFRVDLSLDCGASWVNLLESGPVLGTAPATSLPWAPEHALAFHGHFPC